MRPGARFALGSALLVAATGAIVVFYVLPYVSHLQIAPGDDSSFYVGAFRDVARLGLLDPEIAARPAYPLLGAALGSLSGTSPWVVTAGLPVAMVAALGLASAALASRWGLRGPWLAAFALLAGTAGVAARLVAGKGENLTMFVLLAAIFAIMTRADGPRRWVGIGVVAFAAGITEWPLVLAFLAILGLDLVVELVRRDRDAALDILWLGVATLAGFAAAMLSVLVASHATLAIRHLPGSARYGPRLRAELDLLRAPLTAALAAVGWWAAHLVRHRGVEPVRRLLTVWLAVTGVAVVGGMLGATFLSYRVVTFAMSVLLATAAAAFVVAGWRGIRRHPVVRAMIAVLIAAVAMVPAVDMWYLGFPPPITTPQVLEFETAARYAASLPGDVPAVVVARMPAVHFLSFQRIAHDVQPVGGTDRLLVFIGDVGDALAGRPSKGFTPEGGAIIRELFPPLRRALSAGAPILTGRDLNPHGFATAVRMGLPTIGDGNVVVVRGPAKGVVGGPSVPLPLDPAAVALFAVVALAALFLTGIGWSIVVAPTAPLLVVVALAPALGTAVLSILVFAIARAGFRPAGGAAVTALAVALVASAVAAAFGVAGRRGNRGGPPSVGPGALVRETTPVVSEADPSPPA